MTPLQGKKPLPSSTSTVVLDPAEPKTSQEWRIALHRIKALYFKNQWKQCATRCNDLLRQTGISDHPLNATFLNFYVALSNEAMARLTHNLSVSKLQLLDQAKESYQAAAKALPEVDDHQEDDARSEKTSSSSSGGSSGNSTPTPSRPNSPNYPSSPSSTDSTNETLEAETISELAEPSTPTNKARSGRNPILSPFSANSSPSITLSQKCTLRPSPLRIHKSNTPLIESSTTNTNTNPNEPSTPIAQIIPADISILPTRPYSVTFSTSSYLWLQNRSIGRYNAHISAFTDMLSRHIEAVDALLSTTKEAQANRYAGKRITSCTGDEESRKADLRARVLRLKMSGWERRVFDVERYRQLCDRALGEL